MRILVIEDEILAKDKLEAYVQKEYPEAKLDWIRSVEEGLFYFNEEPEIDLIFSDIQLLDGRSFEIFSRFPPFCPIIFITAFDSYYLDAFATNGISYILKPYSQEDVQKALGKVHRLFPKLDSKQKAWFESLTSDANHNSSFKTTFAIKSSQGTYILETSEIAYFQAQGDFVLGIAKDGKRHPINQTLMGIYAEVNPGEFFQINRSEIVARNCVEGYVNYRKNRLAVNLKTPLSTLYTSNSKSATFKEWYLGK